MCELKTTRYIFLWSSQSDKELVAISNSISVYVKSPLAWNRCHSNHIHRTRIRIKAQAVSDVIASNWHAASPSPKLMITHSRSDFIKQVCLWRRSDHGAETRLNYCHRERDCTCAVYGIRGGLCEGSSNRNSVSAHVGFCNGLNQ